VLVVGTDLDLDGAPARSQHGRVQGLVHVELGHRDVVLEPPGQRLPPGVHDAERPVAVPDRVDEHAHAHEVVDVIEVAAPHDHLLVDRVVVLGPAGDRAPDPRLREVLLDVAAHARQVGLAGRRALGDEVDDLVVHLRVEGLERDVLQLPLDGVHAEPMGERGVDLEGLARLARRGLTRDVLPRAGVVQPVGQLDDEHSDVPGHRHDHLAHGLRLRRVPVGDLVELGDAVDEVRDLLAELLPDARQRVAGVLDRVVQERRRKRGRQHPQLREDGGDGDRVGDVGVTAAADLPGVGLLRDLVGLQDDADVRLRVVRPEGCHQRFDQRGHGVAARTEADEAREHARHRDGCRRVRVESQIVRHWTIVRPPVTPSEGSRRQ